MLSIRSRTFASPALTLVLAAGATGVAQAARDTKAPPRRSSGCTRTRRTRVTASTALLRWDNSSDDFGPVSYEMLVNGVLTDDAASIQPAGSHPSTANGAWVRQLEPGTTYQLTVRARDGSANVSAVSNAVTVTTDPTAITS